MSKNTINATYNIERSNILNSLQAKGMKLTEIRFLAIYQAKINARNPNSREISFSLAEFMKILDLKQVNIVQLKKVADSIICKPVHIPNEYNGFIAVPLFSKCEVRQNSNTLEWTVHIKCSEEVMPYMFEMKKNYFKYQLWNALSLSSVNQIRMYEILKQYEKIGKRTISVDNLKSMLGIDNKQYTRFGDFRNRVLDACQKALEENTDIKYTYKAIKGAKGKVLSIEFTITKNKNFKDDLRLKEFIKPEDLSDITEEPPQMIEQPETSVVETVENIVEPSSVQSKLEELYTKTEKSYSMEQLEILVDLASGISESPEQYIKSIYWQIRARNIQVRNIFSYTLTIIQNKLERPAPQPQTQVQTEPQDWDGKPSYDFDAFLEQIYNQM